ncbi:serine/threonine-protein kinase PAK 3 isoform X2 [Tripterygium wilfordii]|uniref:serine/threonine-protein kinase PAK 3 isoform X2 n=1 Tax=Tripterygium wilfordii TaxID=458696 RepID=UPI0018F840A3|nr:serine/threonine-protein kinase PAK 3 isoform X2 [Tripterygium wilfordii]
MATEECSPSLYRFLADRCETLEASHARLGDQINELMEYNKKKSEVAVVSKSGWGCVPGFFSDGNPFRSILDSMGNAVHVCSASSGEIIYWNRSAESLFGWRDYEVLGENVFILVDEEYYAPLRKIMERLSSGQVWSGQFPFKKRSGENFMAMVTKSPLHEGNELVGFITVSSDAKVFNSSNSEKTRPYQDRSRLQSFNLKNIQSHPHPQIAPAPHIASSVSNLASKLLSRRHGENDTAASAITRDSEGATTECRYFKLERPGTIAAKVLAKLHIWKEEDKNVRQEAKGECPEKIVSPFGAKSAHSKLEDPLPILSFQEVGNELEPGALNLEALPVENEAQRQSDSKRLSSLEDSIGSHGSSSSRGDDESNSMIDCEIQWEDLQVGEEIGQGSYAVVYRGIWNASDVSIKVFFHHEHGNGTFQDYKKEIEIMRSLRHPNVLLFMGAVCSEQRLAIVTEFLPRGSLFRTLHKNNQALDMRRRLRMALDVARGMNYLHHRNPPIIHRDLKSSNLLVDKNWNVKVGDFGLSKWMDATFLTTKSGNGTPQWMAPEVLQNEPSNEKSDVFSFGVILWELMTNKIPWSGLNALQVVGIVGFMNRRLEIPEDIDTQVASIIHACWKSDLKERPSFEEIIQEMTGLIQKFPAASARRSSES